MIDKIIKIRKEKGITQVQLAKMTGLKQEYISYIETGRVKLTLVKAQQILKALDRELMIVDK